MDINLELGKIAHGMNWGVHERVDTTNYRIGLTTHGGCMQRTSDPKKISGDFLVKFGNDWGAGWIHPDRLKKHTWYFMDNPEIPHFLYPNSANRKGLKIFSRFTRNSCFSTAENTEPGHGKRINEILTELAGFNYTWEELVNFQQYRLKNSRKILICPSSPQCYTYYYGISQKTWIESAQNAIVRAGYEPVLRFKPNRTTRNENKNSRLQNSLSDIFATYSQHSATALESIAAGTPAIVSGPHPGGELATPVEEFVRGEIRKPDEQQIYQWFEKVLSSTRFKGELFSGTWVK